MGIHREAGHASARRFQCGNEAAFAADDFGPEFLLLRRVQRHAFVARALLPGSGDKAGPRLNRRRQPGRGAFGAAATVVGHVRSACGAIAGGDDDASIGDPPVNQRWP